MKTNNKLVRMGKVLWLAFCIFIQVYWYKLRKKPEKDWDSLWEQIGKRFRKTLFELEGLLIKIGQFLSIRSDLLPPVFIKQIQDLTDKVPPSEWYEIERILEEEWAGKIDDQLLSINREAIASASIGEVYQGILIDGTKVAIKVQRPQIRSIIHTDFRTLSVIIWFADHFVPIPKGFINFKMLFQELKQVIGRELDFLKEKEALLKFKERFKDSEAVQIPMVFPELCTEKVLVMEWVDGIRLTDWKAMDQFEINRQQLAKRLLEVFLPQWLEPGNFHADPHTGNVLVSKGGKIILLDFGMIGEITKRDATHFQGLIESLLAKNYSKAVESMTELGFILPDVETRTMEKLLAEMLSFKPAQLKEMDLLSLKMEMNDLVKALPIQVPTRFIFLGRSFITVEGIIESLVPEEEFLNIGKPVFLDWLDRQGNSKWSYIWYWLQSQPVFKILHSVTQFIELPERLENLKETEQRREFQFTIYENDKNRSFQLTILGLAGVGIGIYSSNPIAWKIACIVSIVGALGYSIARYRVNKWMKYMPEKKRH